MSKVNIGKMACETCGNDVTMKQNENGTLSYRCDECDAAPYAKTGTLQNEHWRAKLRSLPSGESGKEVTKVEQKAAMSPDSQIKPKKEIGFFGDL